MVIKKLSIAVITMATILLVCLLVVWCSIPKGLTPTASAQGQRRQLTTSHFKNEPVEIVTVKLDGVTLNPSDSFNADGYWPERLRITVKNVSQEPVSWVDVILFTPPANSGDEASFNASYSFGARGGSTTLLQPNESTILTANEAFGDIVSNEPVKILLQHVIWNNDSSLMWSAGKLVRFDPATRSYKPADEPVARYRLPREYQRNRKVVYDPTPFCTERFLSEPVSDCPAWDPSSPSTHCSVLNLQASYNLLGNDVRPFAQHKRCQGCDGIINCAGYKTAYATDVCQPTGDPIVVDVLGDGISLTDTEGGVGFDLFGFGSLVLTAWTTPDSDDAFLVLDRNLNGLIDNGTELFGNMTPQPSTWGDPNGFKALAVFDQKANEGNENGSIDPNDGVFRRLQFWRDENHNGVSEFEELIPFPNTRIESIDLDYKPSKKVDQYGNLFRYRAKVRGKKTNHWAWDVFLLL